MRVLLLDAVRSLNARRQSSIVTVGGLTFAMTACLLLALLAIALSDPDPSVPDPDHVVLLDFKGNLPGQPNSWFTGSPVSFAEMLKDRRAPLDLISRVSSNGLDIDIEGRTQPAYLLIADPDVVPLLGLKALHGDLRQTLFEHDGIAITTDLLRKLWGDLPADQALGRRIESHGISYQVTAVIPNTDPRTPFWEANPLAGNAMAMVGYDSQGNLQSDDDRKAIYMVNGRVFARLRANISVDQVGGWMREAFIANPLYATLPVEWKQGREAAFFRGVTLTRLPFEGPDNTLRWQLLGAAAAASSLLLLLASLNSMNLLAASLLQRQRETAIRQSLGANSSRLVRLWGCEVVLPLFAAGAAALLLTWWLAPTVSNWMGLSPAYRMGDPLPLRSVLGLAIIVLVLAPLTLSFPAWLALRRAPAPALQGRTASEGPSGRRVRQGLLAVQLGGALLLLTLAGVLASQQQYLLHTDRGFDTRNRLCLGVLVNPDQVPNMDAFLAALGRHPAVLNWALSEGAPARDTQGQIETHVSPSQHKTVLRLTIVSPSFFDTYGMTLLAGTPQMGSGEVHMVIDAKAAKLLGFASPQAAVGAQLRGGGGFLQEGTELRRVVAVVKDVKLESARDAALPQAFLLSDKPQWDISIHGTDLSKLRQAVSELWKAYGPPLVYDIQSADEQRASVYRQEEQLTSMLAAIALLAVGVAMLGAYTLVADTLRRRRTELVLHRLHGAANFDITRQVTSEISTPLLVAAIVFLPLAAWLGTRYLATFVDRVGYTGGLLVPMLAASAATLCITALASLFHVRQALRLQPIEALR